jgi:hypothetical protein
MYLFVLYLFLLLHLNEQINAQNSLASTYQRLASLYCYIDDYPAWLAQKSSLDYFLQFAQYFDLDTKRVKEELERHRLQRECLRAVERLPIIVGNG